MTFQCLMDRIFFDLPFCFVYLDDLLVVSRDMAERLQENWLVINHEKCVFGQQPMEFLGHQVLATGISPLPGRVAAIRQFPRPTMVRDLQAFLGLFNFYR
jgi:hypothetical protein